MKPKDRKDKRIAWWRDAKFGLFIHWGVYSVLSGDWKGRHYGKATGGGTGGSSIEWIMFRARIPIREYEEVARRFNPIQFNAAEWVRLAKEAGMKYLVITAKHHDGFCMYKTNETNYNIADFTPFRRDPLKELAAECAKQGLRLGFYYSQSQDWHHPNGGRNSWDFDESKKDFAGYIENYVKPQVRELMTNYGPLGVLWFDTPHYLTPEQSRSLRDMVHQLQPDCLVSGRVGNDAGDYTQLPDRSVPATKMAVDWETPMTMNQNWGYDHVDQDWKSARELIRMLCDVVSRGGNLLLNVGPTAEGRFPQPSIDGLQAMGRWLKVNGESVYGTAASPFPAAFDWGTATARPGRVYLHIYEWPTAPMVLYGLRNRVAKAWMLADSARSPLTVGQSRDEAFGMDELRLELPAPAPEADNSVVVLEIDGQLDVDQTLFQQPDGRVLLPAHLAEIHNEGASAKAQIGTLGMVTNWTDPKTWLRWDFKALRPGRYDVEILTAPDRAAKWDGGHKMELALAGRQWECVVTDDERRHDPRRKEGHLPARNVVTRAGQIEIPAAGACALTLRPKSLNTEHGWYGVPPSGGSLAEFPMVRLDAIRGIPLTNRLRAGLHTPMLGAGLVYRHKGAGDYGEDRPSHFVGTIRGPVGIAA
ncbi:MAG: alpha-L-fucosidase [Candidatus Sumerlaeota bacterium]|nr:alpha-L-fucosidase [Candidatus Sumerlaeota bacterium]